MKYTAQQKAQFALAQERSRMNDLPGTIEILRSLVAESPESAMLNATFANTLKEAGDIGPAVAHFEKAVKLAPNSELYSLGLFHILWGLGKGEEALEETKRFMAISDSEEYREIIAAINTHWPHGVRVKK